MPDQETEVTTTIVEEGKEIVVTEEQLAERIGSGMMVDTVRVTVGESRQPRDYNGNQYSVTFTTSLAGVSGVLDIVKPEFAKAARKTFLGLLLAKMAGQVLTCKRFIHGEFLKDGFGVDMIDWRKGEKAKLTGEG